MNKKLRDEFVTLIDKLKTVDDCHEVQIISRERSSYLQRIMKLDFFVGDRVRFEHVGTSYDGIVERINKKSITVNVGDMTKWKVSPSLLTKV